MALDMFLELDGIEGESQDKDKLKAIHVMAWSWGVTQSGDTHQGKGSGAGKVSVQDLSITKPLDKSSAALLKFACKGKHIDKATLTIRKASGDDNGMKYLVIDFEDLIVASHSHGGSGGEDKFTEHLVLNFGKFHFQYYPQNDDGSAGAVVEHKWDIPANAES